MTALNRLKAGKYFKYVRGTNFHEWIKLIENESGKKRMPVRHEVTTKGTNFDTRPKVGNYFLNIVFPFIVVLCFGNTVYL